MVLALLSMAVLGQSWKLVWADEFNGTGAPDPAKWGFERGFVRNQELQWYQPDNATLGDGLLTIEARRSHLANPNYVPGSADWKKNRMFAGYTSAALETRGLHQWLYGRFEARARIDPALGLWPAIWFLGYGPWPGNGEIDLMEFYRHTVLANLAWGTGRGTWHAVQTPLAEFTKRDPEWADKLHVWRMDWDERWIRLYLDGRLLNETDLSGTVNPGGQNPFHQPHFIILNLAIGSTGGDPSSLGFPRKFEVDYVRVYQKPR